MSPMLGVLGGKSASAAATKRPTLLNERGRGPWGLLASPGRKTPSMLCFVTPAFMRASVSKASVALQALPHVDTHGGADFSILQNVAISPCILLEGQEGAGPVWEVMLYLRASKKKSTSLWCEPSQWCFGCFWVPWLVPRLPCILVSGRVWVSSRAGALLRARLGPGCSTATFMCNHHPASSASSQATPVLGLAPLFINGCELQSLVCREEPGGVGKLPLAGGELYCTR